MLLLRIFLEFCKIGIISFGGGNAVFPILHREVVENLHWIPEQELLYMVSIAETTPGPIAMNLSTFVGYKLYGFLGAIVATAGYNLLPFLIAISVIISVGKLKENKIYKRFLSAVKVVVLVLLMRAVYIITRGGFHDFRPYLLSFASLIFFMKFNKLNPIYLLIATGLIGMIVF
uniref:Chromate transporter n=1 Tax=candidate division WOR-3 bacterium TaxID=2052148 RepID=A0A7C4UFP0_UNCW3